MCKILVFAMHVNWDSRTKCVVYAL